MVVSANTALDAPADNDARQRLRRGCGTTLLVLALAPLLVAIACTGQSTTPATLSNGQFWSLIESLSEPAGTFSLSENFVSNEPFFAENVRMLRPAGGVYIGVGPEQNFSSRSYLATEEGFLFVKDLHARNMIVPVVGDFGGPRALVHSGTTSERMPM